MILLNVHSVGNGKSSQLTNSFFQRGRDQPPFLHVFVYHQIYVFFPCKLCHQDPLKLEVKLPRVDREDRKGVEATRVPLNGEQ